ncbi:MBL fold metallo-hydrolase [Streptomyces sp. NPDC002644]
MSDTGSPSRSVSAAGASLVRGLRPESFGAEPRGERLARIQASPHFADGVFRNPAGPVGTTPVPASRRELAKGFLDREARALRAPARPVPLHPTTLEDLATPPADGLRVTWLGHSTVLTEIDGHRVLFDPVWGRRCSPVTFAGPRRLHPAPVPLAALGPVDVVVISHDHYDHLDMPTIKALTGTDTLFAVPLGVGAHLEHWGVPADRLRELDWHESTRVGGITLTATPARHFCGRGLRNTQHTLWASWCVAGDRHRVFHSGDTGYFEGFRDIGAEHGPFDVTMIQLGAYSEHWPDIHMTPEEGLRAHLDLQGGAPGGILLPIHWGTFNLALHPWAEPAEWARDAAEEAGQAIALPVPGQPFEPGGEIPSDPWWRAVSAPFRRPWRRGGGDGAAEVSAEDGRERVGDRWTGRGRAVG